MALDETRILIDANIFVSFLDENDSLHERASNDVFHHENAGITFILLDHVLQEVLTVFLYRNMGQQAENFWHILQTKENIAVIDTSLLHIESALSSAKKFNYRPKMSLTDWLLFFLSKHWNIGIFTFDQQLKNAALKLS